MLNHKEEELEVITQIMSQKAIHVPVDVTFIQGYVLGFCFNKRLDMVVLIEKIKPEWQAGKLNGVGGHIEEGELAIEAMVREFVEETGVLTVENDWQHFAVLQESLGTVECYYTVNDDYFNRVESTTRERIFRLYWGNYSYFPLLPSAAMLTHVAVYQIKTNALSDSVVFNYK